MPTFEGKISGKLTPLLKWAILLGKIITSNWPPRFGYVGVGVHRRGLTEGGYRGALPIGGGCCPFPLLCVF
jgi:hypothetical protein